MTKKSHTPLKETAAPAKKTAKKEAPKEQKEVVETGDVLRVTYSARDHDGEVAAFAEDVAIMDRGDGEYFIQGTASAKVTEDGVKWKDGVLTLADGFLEEWRGHGCPPVKTEAEYDGDKVTLSLPKNSPGPYRQGA